MFPLFHLYCRVQVDRELHLQPVVQRRDIKAFHTRLIIGHLHIHTAVVLAGVDPVDLPAPEFQFISAGHKVPLLKLAGERPDGTADQPLDPPDHILIPRGAEKHGIPVINDAFFHALRDELLPFLRGHLCPAQLFPVRFSGKTLQRLMSDVPQVQSFKPVLFPVGEAEPVAQEMGVRTGSELFQPRHAHTASVRVELLRALPAQYGILPAQERSPQSVGQVFCALLICGKPCVQLLPLIIQSSLPVSQAFRHSAHPGLSRDLALRQSPFLFINRAQLREEPPDILDQVCRTHGLPLGGHL